MPSKIAIGMLDILLGKMLEEVFFSIMPSCMLLEKLLKNDFFIRFGARYNVENSVRKNVGIEKNCN